MTPIRSINSNKFPGLPTNQTSNGVYPVRPHQQTYRFIRAVDGLADFNFKLTLILKAEV